MAIDPSQNLCAALHPDATAGHAGASTYTGGALVAAAADWGQRLLDRRPLAPGDGVLLAVPDPLAALVGFVALLQRDLIPVPIDPHVGAATLTPILEQTGIDVALVGEGLPRATRERLAERCAVVAVAALDFTASPPTPTPSRRGDDLAMLLFTSGSTGQPKGVRVSHHNLLASVTAILDYLPVAEHPRTGILLPLHYAYALIGQALTAWVAGAQLVFIPGLPGPACEALAAERITGLSSVPTSLRLLCEVLEEEAESRDGIGYVASAGARLPTELHPRLARAFPSARLFNQYGCTEATPRVSFTESGDPRFAEGAIGRPIRDLEVAIFDDDGRPLPPGVEGDLGLRGPNVTAGYWRADGIDPGPRRGDFLLNGDRARLEPDGCLFLAGRRDRLVNCGGERVSLDQVEEVLRAHAAVREVALVARDDAKLGVRIAAFVSGDATQLPELRHYLSGALSPAKRPSRIEFLDRLPQTSSGKTDLQRLLVLWRERE